MEQNKELAELLKNSQAVIKQLNDAIMDLTPMAEFAERVIADDRFYSMKEAADISAEVISQETGQVIGRTKLFTALREIGVLSSHSSNWNTPYRKFIDMGLFHVKIVETGVGMKSVTLVTGKGLQYIQKKVVEYLCI